jgi:hypothetical protein
MSPARYLLVILAAVFVFDAAGPVADEFARFVGVTVLYLFFFAVNPPASIKSNSRRWFGGLAVTLVATWVMVTSPFIRPFAFALFLSGCALAGGGDPRVRRDLDVLTVTASVFAVVCHLLYASAIFYYAVDVFVRTLSELVGGILSRPFSIGETFAGVKILLLLVMLVVAQRAGRGRVRFSDVLASAAAVLAVWFLYVIWLVFLPDVYDFVVSRTAGGLPTSRMPDVSHPMTFVIMASPLLLCVMVMPILRFGAARGDGYAGAAPRSGGGRTLKRLIAPAAAAALFVLGFLLLADHGVRRLPAPGEVLIYEKGFMNFLVPRHGDYGEYSAGMFGNLERHFRALGIPARRTASLARSDLESASGLVLMNINQEIPEEELAAVWEFVEDGGALLVLGDHTFWKSRGVNWLNVVLEPIDISYNFDSAQFFIGGWLNSYRFLHHPLTFGITGERNKPGIVVGASLAVRPPAKPLIVGAFGFSDAGDVYGDSTGYLGNLHYDRGEPLGDLVLAASQRYGRGKVLVFGDTSGFTNPISLWSFPFVKRVLAWMVTGTREGVRWASEIVAMLCVFAGLFLLVVKRPYGPSAAWLLLPAVVLAAYQNHNGTRRLEIPPAGDVAYVDISHCERVPMEGWRKGGLTGLHLNLQREGYLSYVLHDFDPAQVENASLFVAVAPAKPFSKDEIAALERFVEQGGRLLLCIGYEERTAALGLLSRFGLGVDSTPLGNFDVTVSDSLMANFIEAWPVYDESGGGEYVAKYEDYPLIVYKQIGEGGVMLIGDSRFFENENLEHENHPHLESIAFLGFLVEKYLKPGRTL